MGASGEVAGEHYGGAELGDGAGPGQGHSGEQGRRRHRECQPPEGCPGRQAQGLGHFLIGGVDGGEAEARGPDVEGGRHENLGEDHRRGGEGQGDADGRQGRPQQSVPSECHQHSDAGHHRREYDGQFDESVDDPQQGGGTPRQQQGEGRSHDDDDGQADDASNDGEAKGLQHQGAGQSLQKAVLLSGAGQQGYDGQADKQRVDDGSGHPGRRQVA